MLFVVFLSVVACHTCEAEAGAAGWSGARPHPQLEEVPAYEICDTFEDMQSTMTYLLCCYLLVMLLCVVRNSLANRSRNAFS